MRGQLGATDMGHECGGWLRRAVRWGVGMGLLALVLMLLASGSPVTRADAALKLPSVTVPSVTVPSTPVTPAVTTPTVSTPSLPVPTVSTPSLPVPTVSTPSLPAPTVPKPSLPSPSAPAPSLGGVTRSLGSVGSQRAASSGTSQPTHTATAPAGGSASAVGSSGTPPASPPGG